MNKIKIVTDYKNPSKEEIKAFQDFDALLDRFEKSKKQGILISFKPFAAAASVVLAFVGLTVLAYVFVAERKEEPNKESIIEKKVNADLPPNAPKVLDIEPQWFLLDNTKQQQIETKMGKIIDFPPFTFNKTKSNKILLNIAELQDTAKLASHFIEGEMALFICAFDLEKRKTLHFRKKAKCTTVMPDNVQLKNEIWHNADYANPTDWTLQSKTQGEYIKINKAMKLYQDYAEARQLLDSLTKNYTLQNGKYISATKTDIQFTENYVKEVKKFVAQYEGDAHFALNTKIAKALWAKYQDQQTISVSKDAIGLFEFEIDQAGWWVLK